MSELFIFSEKIDCVFQLLGQDENDISFSVGYAFSKCEHFLRYFLEHLKLGSSFQKDNIKVKLQTHEKAKGFTDFEIIQEGEVHLIIEAKRNWDFPSDNQLKKYASRKSFKKSMAKHKIIVIFNESTREYTQSNFGIRKVGGISVEVVSWHQLHGLSDRAIKAGSKNEKYILRELNIYLDKISTMQKTDSNWVYVVSLSTGNLEGSEISTRDIVNRHNKYFHPVGGGKGGWPTEPPNYIAFRYDGKLQSIHHIEKYQVFTDPSIHFRKIPKAVWKPHYLYTLGPSIRPSKEVKAGDRINKGRSMRVWAMLDLLLTSNTIQEARDKSNQREAQMKTT